MRRLLFLTIFVALPALAQPPRSSIEYDWLIGTWRGTSSGKPGEGVVEKTCERMIGRYVQCRTTVNYPAKGEVHNDVAIYSLVSSGKVRVRQFHSEGYITTYSETEPLVFVTDDIENLPKGWRAREAWTRPDEMTLNETFSLAAPGKDFETYSTSRMKKVGILPVAPDATPAARKK